MGNKNKTSERTVNRWLQLPVYAGYILFLAIMAGTGMNTNAQGLSSSNLLSDLYAKQTDKLIKASFENEPLEQALRHVAKEAKVGISFETGLVTDERVSGKYNGNNVFDVVSDILYETGLKATLSSNRRTIIVKESKEILADDAVNETITGSVTDQTTGESLPGVNIIVDGTNIGVTTDVDGNYTIDVPDLDVTLIFSYVGYQPSEIAVDGRTEIDVAMVPASITGDDVLVVAYGTANREEFVGSATQISARNFEKREITSVTQIVEGASPGVLISPGSGQPGSSPNIRIRGIGSVGSSNAPLIVVDGSIYSGQLASINPNDIESLSILKDAASTSLYGSGAANGVIMITTKEGRQNGGQVTINLSQGVVGRSVPEYDRVDARGYYPLFWEGLKNQKVYSGGLDEQQAAQEASDEVFDILAYNPFDVPTDQIVNTDGELNPNANLIYDDNWQDELLRDGARSRADISYSGRADNTSYYTSFGYLDETGYIINSDFERYNARLRVDTSPRDWVKLGVNLAGTSSESNAAIDGVASSTSFVNPYRATRLMGPIYPVYARDRVTGELIEEGLYDRGDARPEASGRHAVQENILNSDVRKNTNLDVRTRAEFYYNDKFTFTLNASLDRRNYNRDRARNSIIGDAAPGGDAYRYNTVFTGISLDQLLRYEDSFQDHNLSVLLGHDSFQYERNYQMIRRSQQVAEGNTELINYVNLNSGTSNTREYRREGFFTRVNYDFASTYYLSGSLRYDGSSRFQEDVRWSPFWSVGASWRIDQEDFMDRFDFVNSLKLRSSYGQVGNDSNTSHTSLSFYAYQALYELGVNNASEAGILLSTAGNPALQWESNEQFDIALEFELVDSRYRGTLEWYNRQTSDLLFDVPLPLSTGLDEYPDNIGTMFNRGLELTLETDIVQNDNFQWNLMVSAATIQNEFKELPQEEIINGTKKLQVGSSIYDYWLRQWAGVDPDDGSGLYIASEEAIEEGGDDLRQVDGQTVTINQNNAEYAYVGSAIPDLFGSFSNTFSYKGLSLSTLFTYQIGGQTYDSNYSSLMHPTSADGRALHTDIEKRWQQPGDITNVPRLDRDQAAAFNAASSRWLVDSDYLALRNLNLTYAFAQSVTERLGVSNTSVFLNAENLLQITARKGLEAAQQFNGTTNPRYTPSRVVTIGLNLTF